MSSSQNRYSRLAVAGYHVSFDYSRLVTHFRKSGTALVRWFVWSCVVGGLEYLVVFFRAKAQGLDHEEEIVL